MTARLLAPDFARGWTLLGIALANCVTTWIAPPDTARQLYGAVRPDSRLDLLFSWLGAVFTDVRGVAMFCFLFGYGVAMVANKQAQKGKTAAQARWLMWRRFFFLLLIGVAHAYLFAGDVIVSYALIGLLLTCFITISTKILRVLVLVGIALLQVPVLLVFLLVGDSLTDQSQLLLLSGSASDYFQHNFVMASLMLLANGLVVLPLVPVALAGMIAGRFQVMEHPACYRRKLWVLTLITLAGMLVMGTLCVLPAAHGPSTLASMAVNFNQVVGLWFGPGILAGIVLAAEVVSRKGWTKMFAPVTALGRRSMTGYVLQTLIFLSIMPAFGLGLGSGGGATTGFVCGFGCWLLTVIICFGLDKAGWPGPLEALHRRATYGKSWREVLQLQRA